ncbi:hypothetical protein ACLMNJ_31595 [Streptomyces seoulensis]
MVQRAPQLHKPAPHHPPAAPPATHTTHAAAVPHPHTTTTAASHTPTPAPTHRTPVPPPPPPTHTSRAAAPPPADATAPPEYTAIPPGGFDPRELTDFQLDELVHRIIGRVTRLIRTELRLDRERIGKLRDPRR